MRFLLSVICWLYLASVCFAGNIQLQWNPNSEPDLQSYNVYYGTQSRVYGPPVPVGNSTNYQVNNLEAGKTYYFAITAVDTSGNESDFSQEIDAYIRDTSTTQNFNLLISQSPDRSNALNLQGTNAYGDVFIFLETETNDGISRVEFSLDGTPKSYEGRAPYDLLGGEYTAANALDTTGLADDQHEVVAIVELTNGDTQTISATFSVSNYAANNDPAPPQDTNQTSKLMLSTTANRANAVNLQGTIASGDAFIFLETETNDGISRVEFSLDGTPKSYEGRAPYDLLGGESTAANALDTNGLADGQHEVVAIVKLDTGESQTIRAAFSVTNYVANNDPAPPQDTNQPYTLMLSTTANRANALNLQGATVSGDAFIFLETETNDGISKVEFSLDGIPKSAEGNAPYDLLGGESAAANALDTNGLADGQHNVVAVVKFSDGSSQTLQVTFNTTN